MIDELYIIIRKLYGEYLARLFIKINYEIT